MLELKKTAGDRQGESHFSPAWWERKWVRTLGQDCLERERDPNITRGWWQTRALIIEKEWEWTELKKLKR